MIGGWYIGKETLEGGGGKYVVVTDKETGELKIETVPNKEAAIILNSTEGSIAGGILRSTDARPIFLDGTLSVSLEQKSYNPDYSANYGYMGAVRSNMGTIFDSNIGVGMWATNSVVKATTANVGMAFSSDCIYINKDGLHVHTGDTSEAAAAR
jgi:hypothetical protein